MLFDFSVNSSISIERVFVNIGFSNQILMVVIDLVFPSGEEYAKRRFQYSIFNIVSMLIICSIAYLVISSVFSGRVRDKKKGDAWNEKYK